MAGALRDQVRVAQWNILADGLAQTGRFAHCHADHLQWDYRRSRIAKRLAHPSHTDAYDFATLQEVNRIRSLTQEIENQGGSLNEYIFEEKTSSPAEQLGYPGDGCAILYNSTRWKLLKRQGIQFYDLPTHESEREITAASSSSSSTDIHSQRGIVGLFQAAHDPQDLLGNPPVIMICAMHFKAKKGEENEQKRFRQARQLKTALSRIRKEWAVELILTMIPPVIIGCDMNDVPGSKPHTEMLSTTGDNIQMESAYGSTSGELPFTTWKFRQDPDKRNITEVKRTIDYIFYQKRELNLESCCELPSEDTLGTFGLPTAEYPSDHLQLSSTFNFSGGLSGSMLLDDLSSQSRYNSYIK